MIRGVLRVLVCVASTAAGDLETHAYFDDVSGDQQRDLERLVRALREVEDAACSILLRYERPPVGALRPHAAAVAPFPSLPPGGDG